MTRGQELSEKLFDEVSDMRDFLNDTLNLFVFSLGGLFKTIQEVEEYLMELEEENENQGREINDMLLQDDDDLDLYGDRF